LNNLIEPYGGRLVDLLATPERAETLKREAFGLPSLDLDWRQLCDLEMLMNGAYSPLTGFMTRVQCDKVEASMQLDDGRFWPVPISLGSTQKAAAALKAGDRVALRDGEGFMLAVLSVSDVWQDGELTRLGGEIEGVALPPHPDFSALRATPLSCVPNWHGVAGARWWRGRRVSRCIARNTNSACAPRSPAKPICLLHPQAGGDITDAPGYFGLVRSFLAARERFPTATTQLALLPIPPRPVDARDLMLRAIVARNYGCTALIVGGEYESSARLAAGAI
jgi:sulfate adenylyltransferase